MSSQAQLQPTFQGYIGSTTDALLLFECCLAGSLRHVSRRAHDRERHSLIKSGNVFIYEENTSGIKRWTDGISWSPSRILGNFLVYRQLERPFPPGEKKRAKKNRNKISGGVKSQSSSEGLNSGEPGASSSSYSEPGAESGLNKETTRMLFGSLEDSYDFKKDGLIKKTISVTVNGTSHHLVSYYTVADILANRLTSPTRDPQFTGVNLRDELTPQRQNFRTPIDEVSTLDYVQVQVPPYASYAQSRNGYEMTNQSVAQRSMSLPGPALGFGSSTIAGFNVHSSMGAPTWNGIPQGVPPPAVSNSNYNNYPATAGVQQAAGYVHGHVQYRHQQQHYQPAQSNGQRSAGQPATDLYDRRLSYADPGMSGYPPTSVDPRYAANPAYSPFGSARDGFGHPQTYTTLPTPPHTTGQMPAPHMPAPSPVPNMPAPNSASQLSGPFERSSTHFPTMDTGAARGNAWGGAGSSGDHENDHTPSHEDWSSSYNNQPS